MPPTLEELLEPSQAALVTQECQNGVIGDHAIFPALAEAARDTVIPNAARLTKAARASGVPVIHFGTGTAALLPLMREAGGDVMGLDWRVDLDRAWASVGHDVGVQGNLDPAALLARPAFIRQRATDILARAAGRPPGPGPGKPPVPALSCVTSWQISHVSPGAIRMLEILSFNPYATRSAASSRNDVLSPLKSRSVKTMIPPR